MSNDNKPTYDEIKYYCCFGEIEYLKLVSKEILNDKIIKSLIDYMNGKQREIAMWLVEDNEPDVLKQQLLTNRNRGITECITYLKSLKMEYNSK
jgi:hypothetical protein